LKESRMMKESNSESENHTPIFPILLVNFIGTLGFSIVLPFLVFLVIRFGGNAVVYGIMAAFYPIFQLMGAPILGKWSDIKGRRRILLLSQIGTTFSWVLFLIALFVPITTVFVVDSDALGSFIITVPILILFFARALDGITGGNISVANAYIADISSESNRKKNYGKMAVSASLGFIVGPALAGILGATVFGETLPVLAALLISVAASIIILLYLPESKASKMKGEPNKKGLRKIFGQEQKPGYEIDGEDKIKLKDIRKIKHIPYVLMLYFLIFLGFNMFYTSFPIHAIEGLNWSIATLGFFLAALSLIMVIVSGPVLSKLSKTTSDSSLVVGGGIVLGFNFVLLTSENEIFIYLAAVLFGIGNGLMWPSFLSLVSKLAGEKYQGSVQGVGSSAGALASIIGLILGGFLYSGIGVVSFLFSAAVIFVVTGLSVRLIGIERRREKEMEKEGSSET
jgi:MFS family permease